MRTKGLTMEIEAVPVSNVDSLRLVCLAASLQFGASNSRTRSGVSDRVRRNGLEAIVGRHHVAVYCNDSHDAQQPSIIGDRVAIITGTGEDWR